MKISQQNRLFFIIKIILFLQISFIPASAFCGQVTLAWTQNTEPDIAGYRIFCREENSVYTFTSPLWEGVGTRLTITDLEDDAGYYFLVRSYTKSGIESLNSNEVYIHTPPAPSSTNDDDIIPDQDAVPSDNDTDATQDQDSTPSDNENPTGNASDTCYNCNVVEIQVADGNDDAEEFASGDMYLTSSDLELVYDQSNQTVGIRFRDVNIPPGSTVVRAYIQFQTDEENGSATSLTIKGEAVDDASSFSSSPFNITNRNRTTASTDWYPDVWRTLWEAGPKQQTPDISSIIQEIVNRSGWTTGNALAILFTGNGERVAESYEGNPDGAPLLYIEYLDAESKNVIKNSDDTIQNTPNSVSEPTTDLVIHAEGNSDWLPDEIRDNVMSIMLKDGQQLTIASSEGTTIYGLEIKEKPSSLGMPSDGLDFTYGLIDFTIENVDVRGSAVVTLYFPEGSSPETYYKYGPTPDKPEDHWYEFAYDGETGAQIDGNIIALHFVDGKRGDDNLQAKDNKISDSVGGAVFRSSQAIAIEPDDTTTSFNSDSKGNSDDGCFIQSLWYNQ